MLGTYTGPARNDQIMFDLVNRLSDLCPIQWWCDQCRFRLHCGVDPGGQPFLRPAFTWTTSRTGRASLQEATHPLMVPHNLYRWNEIGGLQENGNHTDYRVLHRMDKISPTMQVGGPCGMSEPIANTLSHVATPYASRHDCIEHQWIKVAGFLTGRVGNWKHRVTYNRHVLDIDVQAEQIRDDRSSAGIVYHSRKRQQWVPGVHAPTAPANAGRPCRYVNGIFASAVLSTTQTSFDYDVTGLYQNGDLLLSDAHHPWLVNPNTIQHLPPEVLPQAFRQIGASTHSSIWNC